MHESHRANGGNMLNPIWTDVMEVLMSLSVSLTLPPVN